VCYTFHNTSNIQTEVWRIPILPYSVLLYVWKINKPYCRYKYFTPDTISFVVRKRSKHRYPPPRIQCYVGLQYIYLKYFWNCAFLIKIRESRPLRISTPMRKNSIWMFLLLSSTAMTPGIIETWRLIFVLEPFKFQSLRPFEFCITCDQVLSVD